MDFFSAEYFQENLKWPYTRPKWRDGGSLANTMLGSYLNKPLF